MGEPRFQAEPIKHRMVPMDKHASALMKASTIKCDGDCINRLEVTRGQLPQGPTAEHKPLRRKNSIHCFNKARRPITASDKAKRPSRAADAKAALRAVQDAVRVGG